MESAQPLLSETRKKLADTIEDDQNEHCGNQIIFRNAFPEHP